MQALNTADISGNKAALSNTRKNEAGFTLVELSIVLVIIGLIVGGVLVGQNLIRSAELRATIGQIESYNTAVNTFRGKYGGIPGDFRRADRFGLGTAGNGNSLLDDSDADTDPDTLESFDAELSQYWIHLSAAEMIGSVITAPTGATVPDEHYPLSKHGVGGMIAFGDRGSNNFLIGVNAAADDDLTNMVQNTLTPVDAYTIDSKMDNGYPLTGIVRYWTYGNTTDDFDIPVAGEILDAAAADATDPSCIFGDITGSTLDQTDPADQNQFEYNAAYPDIACMLKIKAN